MTVDSTAIERAKDLVNAHRYTEGAALLRTYLEAHPDDAVAWRRLAGALIGANDNEGALVAATRSVELDPTNPTPHRYQAMAYLWLKRYEELRVAAGRADELGPDDPETLTLMAYGAAFAGRDWASARVIANRALGLGPDNEAARATARYFRRARTRTSLLACVAPILALVIVLPGMGVAVSLEGVAAGLFVSSAAAFIVLSLTLGWTRKWPVMPMGYRRLFGAIAAGAVIAGLCTWAATGRPVAVAVATAATVVLAAAVSARLLVALARRRA